jgi:hypothetical protein
MSPTLVTLCYGSALVLASLLLWHFGVRHWYWHVFSFGAAMALGLTPLPQVFNTPNMTLLVGWVFTFLFVWGIGGGIKVLIEHAPQAGHRHHYR